MFFKILTKNSYFNNPQLRLGLGLILYWLEMIFCCIFGATLTMSQNKKIIKFDIFTGRRWMVDVLVCIKSAKNFNNGGAIIGELFSTVLLLFAC